MGWRRELGQAIPGRVFLAAVRKILKSIEVRPHFNNGVLIPMFADIKLYMSFLIKKLRLRLKLSFGPMVSIALLVLGQESHECSRYRTMVLRAP
jgi:hypothetical protein